MCLRRTDLLIKNYALDLLGSLSLENCIFLGQFRELLFEVAGSEGKFLQTFGNSCDEILFIL